MSDSEDKSVLDHHGNPIPKRIPLWSRVKSASARTKAIIVSSAAALALVAGVLANLDTISTFFGFGGDTGPDVRVFFAAVEPQSDFEMARGGRTLVFVRIPRLEKPVNRLIFGTALVRPVNLDSRSLRDVSITTIYAKDLWHPSLGTLERESVTPIAGALKFDFDVNEVDDRWLATRTISRLDPKGGAPFPVCFLLEVHGSTEEGNFQKVAKGELEIRVVAPDWKGLNHVLDVRCVVSESSDDFIASCRKLAATLRADGYEDVPVVLADTGGKGVIASEGPTILQANVHAFLTLDEQTLHDF